MQTTILAGVFEQEAQARQALAALKRAGFAYDQIGIATPGQRGAHLQQDLLDAGFAPESAAYYDKELNAGRTIVSVRPDDREQEVHELLHRYGGNDYEHQTAETQTAAGYTRGTPEGSTHDAAHDSQDAYYQPRSLRLREERLGVTKERVQTGEVKLHKDVVTEQQAIDVPVKHEEVVLEQRSITGGKVDTSTPIGEGETIRVPVNEEQVTVTKDTVETGEVAVGKRRVNETQRVEDSVKREELSIEEEGNVALHGTPSDPFHPDQIDPELAREVKKKPGSRARKKK